MIMPKNPVRRRSRIDQTPAEILRPKRRLNAQEVSAEEAIPAKGQKRAAMPLNPKPAKQEKKRRLTPRQREFLDAINEDGRYRLDHAMYKANVKQRLLERWMADPLFLRHLHRRVLGLRLNQYLFLQYCQPIAADRLLTLMHYKKGDVVQKACANLFHMVKHCRPLEKEYLPDETPSLDPAPDPVFVTNEIEYGHPDEEFIEKYEHRMTPRIPNPQDYF